MSVQERFALKNKLIAVTGASSGIGRQIAVTASSLGAKVILISRDETRLEETSSLLHGDGHSIHSFDVVNLEGIKPFMDSVVSTSGKLDGFVHSAGVRKTLPLKSSKPSVFTETTTVNFYSAMEFVRVLSGRKYSNEMASFVLISSIMGVLGEIGLAAYSASKGALISAARSISLEIARRNQRINCISPAMVKTSMMDREFSMISQEAVNKIRDLHPLGFGAPDDVADAAAFLLSDCSRWITGTNMVVDGGYSSR